jgi:hypothetical protein
MQLDQRAVESAIKNAIAATDEEGSFSPQQIADITFHMTDWLSDLERFAEFCTNPSSRSVEEASEILMAFLYHVPNHIAAAAKQYLDSPVRDVFGVGAVEATERRST